MTTTANELGEREEKGKQDKETIIFQNHFFFILETALA
jgi:hypothetical protein